MELFREQNKRKNTEDLETFNSEDNINTLQLKYNHLKLKYNKNLIEDPVNIASSKLLESLIDNRQLYGSRLFKIKNNEQAIATYKEILHYIKIHDLSKNSLKYKFVEAIANCTLGSLYQYGDTALASKYFATAISIYESLNYKENTEEYNICKDNIDQLTMIISELQSKTKEIKENSDQSFTPDNTSITSDTDPHLQTDVSQLILTRNNWLLSETNDDPEKKQKIVASITQLLKDIQQLPESYNKLPAQITIPKSLNSLNVFQLTPLEKKLQKYLKSATQAYTLFLMNRIDVLTKAIINKHGKFEQEQYMAFSLEALETKVTNLEQQLNASEPKIFSH